MISGGIARAGSQEWFDGIDSQRARVGCCFACAIALAFGIGFFLILSGLGTFTHALLVLMVLMALSALLAVLDSVGRSKLTLDGRELVVGKTNVPTSKIQQFQISTEVRKVESSHDGVKSVHYVCHYSVDASTPKGPTSVWNYEEYQKKATGQLQARATDRCQQLNDHLQLLRSSTP
jgi:hypothetical protein